MFSSNIKVTLDTTSNNNLNYNNNNSNKNDNDINTDNNNYTNIDINNSETFNSLSKTWSNGETNISLMNDPLHNNNINNKDQNSTTMATTTIATTTITKTKTSPSKMEKNLDSSLKKSALKFNINHDQSPRPNSKNRENDNGKTSESNTFADTLESIKFNRKRTISAPNFSDVPIEKEGDVKNDNQKIPINSTTNPASKSMYDISNTKKIDSLPLNRSINETPQQYLDKLRDTLSKSELITLLAKSKDVFHESVLHTYLEIFDFESDPIDIALRKFLMECHLPKESQQIDRVMEAFAKRYHDCNPSLFPTSDVSYMLSFSLLMLHTDAFNKNVKRKMTKEEFIKNTTIDGVPSEILEKTVTEFKPDIVDLVPLENPYSYKGTLSQLNTTNIHQAFTSARTIKITGVRTKRCSRIINSNCNGSNSGDSNVACNPICSSSQPLDENDRTFILKITKTGRLGRKIDLVEGGKRANFTRNWKEFGVILSGSQLMFFRIDIWINSKISELNDPSSKNATLPVLKPNLILMTGDSIAVYDKSYTKYPNVFRLVLSKGDQYLFQAENKNEMNDWIVKINYAATFKTVNHEQKSQPQTFFNYQNDDEINTNDAKSRADVLRTKIQELQVKIAALTSQLQTDVRFRNNLVLMIPYKASTRDRIIQVAMTVGKRIKRVCLELSRFVCYQKKSFSKHLVLESNNSRPFTMAVTNSTPDSTPDLSSVNNSYYYSSNNSSSTVINTFKTDTTIDTKYLLSGNTIFHQLQPSETELEVIESIEIFEGDDKNENYGDNHFKNDDGKDDNDTEGFVNRNIKNDADYDHAKEVVEIKMSSSASTQPQWLQTLPPSLPPLLFLTTPSLQVSFQYDDDGGLDEFVDAQENINEL
ncbi:12533_t:CDS:10 [Entrophospora sp. SA101]|nr:12533_t:CDS:10 [Entrophospora sp. SA101]CAJ0926072.1 18068_t:CDS:10 [Entrophospora sp. SA101]CAJ0926081.1 151_t:CDS:10 [Entrophospora sp. SA101]